MSAFAVFSLKIATFLGQLGKTRVPACIFRFSVRVRVIPETEYRDRVDSGCRFFGSGFGYPITRAASSTNMQQTNTKETRKVGFEITVNYLRLEVHYLSRIILLGSIFLIREN